MAYTAAQHAAWRATLSGKELAELEEDERRDAEAEPRLRREAIRQHVERNIRVERKARSMHGEGDLYRTVIYSPHSASPRTLVKILRQDLRRGDCKAAKDRLATLKSAIKKEIDQASRGYKANVRENLKQLLRGIEFKTRKTCTRRR